MRKPVLHFRLQANKQSLVNHLLHCGHLTKKNLITVNIDKRHCAIKLFRTFNVASDLNQIGDFLFMGFVWLID